MEFNDDLGRPFVDENNRTLVPLRAVMESFGCEVEGVQTEYGGYIVVKKCVSSITLYINSNIFYCSDSETHYMDTKPVLINNRTYLPIRFVVEAFDGTVNGIQDAYTVEIISGLGIHTVLPDYNDVKVHFMYNDKEYWISGLTSSKIYGENTENNKEVMDLMMDAMESMKANKLQEANDTMAMAGTYLQKINGNPIEEYQYVKEHANIFSKMLDTFTYEVYTANESKTSSTKSQHLIKALDAYMETIKGLKNYGVDELEEINNYINENNPYRNKD